MGADHPAADHDHTSRRDTRHTAEKDAPAAGAALQRGARGFDRKSSRDLAHRREQRQVSFGIGDRLIGDCGAAGFHQAFSLLRIGRQMQISEEDLALAQLRPFARLRLLHLHDHVGIGENLGSGFRDAGSGLAVDLIARADAGTGVGLDHHAVTVLDIFANGAGGQADAVFMDFDFLWHTDAHRWTLPGLPIPTHM